MPSGGRSPIGSPGEAASIVVGQDTRRSGDMFVAAIAAGATSLGVDVHIVGVVPTPALAYLAGNGPFAAGIMVSASHNPADDNGLKVLDGDGLKLDDAVEDELEQLIWRTEELVGPPNAELGRMIDASRAARRLPRPPDRARGVDRRRPAPPRPRRGERLGVRGRAEDPRRDRRPDRRHPRRARRDRTSTSVGSDRARVARRGRARSAGADVGFALDGDADRLIAVDAEGHVVDGDQVLGILALDRLERGELTGGGLVVSVLSNGGLGTVVEAAGGQLVRTPVGDKYILEGMQVTGAVLGGEKSGHVIVLEHTTSGDGIVTALEVLRVMCRRGSGLAELAAAIPMLPQQQRAVKARHKDQWESDPTLQRAIADGDGASRRHRPGARPPVGHGARAAGDGRGSGRRPRPRAGRLARGPGRGASKLARGESLRADGSQERRLRPPNGRATRHPSED